MVSFGVGNFRGKFRYGKFLEIVRRDLPKEEVDIAITQKTQTQPNPNPTLGWVWVRIFDPTLGFGLRPSTQTQRWGPKENPKNPE
jgi:hypothetical protein